MKMRKPLLAIFTLVVLSATTGLCQSTSSAKGAEPMSQYEMLILFPQPPFVFESKLSLQVWPVYHGGARSKVEALIDKFLNAPTQYR